MMQPQTRAVLVSHTHWDRAWYLPFQVYRIRLVRLIDRLLDLLERDRDFRSFTLDGQILPVADYLEIRPERRADLERLIRAGRLLVGPWYVLSDEYLVSPEALIRNLMLGLRMARELGGAMREGYAPDAFGHIGQLPQILRGFDIDSAIFWRGMGDEGEELGTEYWWEAPDGSRVMAVHLREAYSNAANLGYPVARGDPSGMPFDMARALDRLREAIDQLGPHGHAGAVLLMNGDDHLEPDPHVPAVIARANEAFADVEIAHGTLSDYVGQVRVAARDRLPTFQGEFNRSRYAFGLQGVYSSRMYINQANERAQTLLECYAEPLSAWAWLLDRPSVEERRRMNDTRCCAPYGPGPFLDRAWRKLLQNHPHDDVCGCSVDAVHRENMVRFGEVEQIGTTLVRDAYRVIMQRIDRTAQPGVPFVLFNPTAWSRTETVEVELPFEDGDETTDSFQLVDAAGRVVPCEPVERYRCFEAEVGKSNHLHVVRAALSVRALPACGYRVYYAQRGSGRAQPAVEHPVEVLANGMENQHLRIEIEADGTLTVVDKHTGRRFQQLGYFVDDEDAGDEYDYAPCPNPERFCTMGKPASIRLRHAGPLQARYEISQELALPASLTEDRQGRSSERVGHRLTTTVTLRHDSRRLALCTTVDNRARDHRLRVCFPSGLQTDVAHADGHFDVLARPLDLPRGEGWDQPPVPTRHQRYFVDLSDGEAGLAILNRGLPEYEVLRDGGCNTIALTLLRCVGYLSRGEGDMPTRPGLAGPPLATPEAQCQGVHTFEYAILPHPGNWGAMYRDAYSFRAPIYLRRGTECVRMTREGHVLSQADGERGGIDGLRPPELDGDLPTALSFLTLGPEALVLSAVKRSEDGNSLIVRFYNPTSEPLEATLQTVYPIGSAQEVTLNEEPLAKLTVDGEGHGDAACPCVSSRHTQTAGVGTTQGEEDASASRARPMAGQAVILPIGGKQVKTIALQLEPMDIE